MNRYADLAVAPSSVQSMRWRITWLATTVACALMASTACGQFLSVIPREWTVDGKAIEATFLSSFEGVITLKRTSDNETIEVKLEQLAQEDREFIDGLSTDLPEFQPPPGPIKVRGRVIDIVDGDTITLLVDGQAFRCRLKGIDAPEMKQPFGPEAAEALHRACFGRVVQAEGHGTEHYGRQLVVIKLGKRNLNGEMIKLGFAWHFRPMGVDQKLAMAEEAAKKRRKGLWKMKDPIKPWEWRKQYEQRPAPTRER